MHRNKFYAWFLEEILSGKFQNMSCKVEAPNTKKVQLLVV